MTTESKNKLDEILNKYYIPAWRISDKVTEKYNIDIIEEFLKHNSSYVAEHCLNCNDIEIYLNVQNIFKIATNKSKEKYTFSEKE